MSHDVGTYIDLSHINKKVTETIQKKTSQETPEKKERFWQPGTKIIWPEWVNEATKITVIHTPSLA